MTTFEYARIALLEARMSSEMADLIRRNGGQPYSVPAVRETPVESQHEVANFIDHLSASALQIVVFFTGVGVNTLLRDAEQLGRQPELLENLHNVTVVARGPKPSAVLRRNNIPIAYSAVEPYTTDELIAALVPVDVQGKGVGIVHYGERNTQLTEYLTQRGAQIEELILYEWKLPEDTAALKTLVNDVINGRVDALVFTSQVQVRHLFQIAEDLGQKDALASAMRNNTIVASVGPTCTGVLQQYGVPPHVEPEHPKMGHLVKALQTYMSQ